MLLSTLMSPDLLLVLLLEDLAGAEDFTSNLFKSSLSAFKLNLILDCLKPVTSTLPVSLVTPSIFTLNWLLASSFLISVCAAKLKLPFMPPFGKLGSFISKLPANFGKSKIKFSILPLNGDENFPVTVRWPCTAERSPVMPLLCSALGEPFMSASTKLALNTSPAFSWPKLTVTFLLETSFFKMLSAGAFKSIVCLAPSNLPEATNFKSSTKNSINSGLASISPLVLMSISVPFNISPTMWLSKPFTLKCLVSGSTKKLPLSLMSAAVSGWLAVKVKLVSKSTGSASAICPEVKLNLLTLYLAPVLSSAYLASEFVTMTPSTSNLNSSDSSSSLLIKSSKLNVPSLCFTTLAIAPST